MPIEKRKKNSNDGSKKIKKQKISIETNESEEVLSEIMDTDAPAPRKRERSDEELGRKNAWRKVNNLQLYKLPKNKREEYIKGFNYVYNELYVHFDGIRDDSNIEQLAFVLGLYDMAKKNGIARERPKNPKTLLHIHWDKYLEGSQSYKDPLAKLDLEKDGVGVLFSFTPKFQSQEAGRNLAVQDYIQGKSKRSSQELASIDANPTDFVQSYEFAYEQFGKGYTMECASMRKGITSDITITTEDKSIYLAGIKYALYEFMRSHSLSRRPTNDFLANLYGEEDALHFNLPTQLKANTDFKAKYLKKYTETLADIEKNGTNIQKELVKLLKKYQTIKDTLGLKKLKKEMKAAKARGRDAYNHGSQFRPDPKKIAENDPIQIAYEFTYYRTLLNKGEKTVEEKTEDRAKASARVAAIRGHKPKTADEIEQMKKVKGEVYTEAYLKIHNKQKSKISHEQSSFNSFYEKGRNQAYVYISRLLPSLKLCTFNKNDPLYLLKNEAYLLGLLKGLETTNVNSNKRTNQLHRTQFEKQLNAIYQNPARKVFPNIKKMRGSVSEEEARCASSDNTVRVGEVMALKGEKGLFAQRIIYPGEFFIEYAGEIISKEEAEKSFYAANLDGNWVIDASKKGNEAKYVNHSENPNAQLVVMSDDKVMIEALETIEKDQQILVNYGNAFTLENNIGLNPWDNEASAKTVYENNIRHYSVDPFYFDPEFTKLCGLPSSGPYLVPHLMKAIISNDTNTFNTHLKQEILELPILAISDLSSSFIFSDNDISYYFNALMLACFVGSPTYVKKLLEAGARGNILQRNNNSLFHIVFQGAGKEKGKIEIALLLLENNVNPFVINNDEISFFTFMNKVTSKLLKLSVLDQLDSSRALLFSCYSESQELVELLAKKNHRFDLTCLVEGRLPSNFRNKVVNFLIHLSRRDKKLVDTILGYVSIYSVNKTSTTKSFRFFNNKQYEAMDASGNNLLQNFYSLTEEEFENLYALLSHAGMLDLYPALKNDLDMMKSQFEALIMPAIVLDKNNVDINELGDPFEEFERHFDH